MVEISGIELLTCPATNAGGPPEAEIIIIQEVSGCNNWASLNEKDSHSAVSFHMVEISGIEPLTS